MMHRSRFGGSNSKFNLNSVTYTTRVSDRLQHQGFYGFKVFFMASSWLFGQTVKKKQVYDALSDYFIVCHMFSSSINKK